MLAICRAAGARTVTKGKSMIAEEIGINDHLEQNGIAPIETDLGEYIIQLRHETPSHIIAPAIHLIKGQVEETFRAAHTHLDPARPLAEARQLCDEARALLRPKFLAADVGITGANFLVAETGSSIIVTNEGNGDLTQNLTRVHIVLRQHREDRADAGGCVDVAASVSAFGDRPGIFDLHHGVERPAPARATPTGRRNITSCCSTTGAARCSAPSSRTFCAASAAALASTIARFTARSAATPMAGSMAARWARC